MNYARKEILTELSQVMKRQSVAGGFSSRCLCFLGTAQALLKRPSEAETAYHDAIAPLFKLAMSEKTAFGRSGA